MAAAMNREKGRLEVRLVQLCFDYSVNILADRRNAIL
jgi:hypothetical protein